MNQPFRFFWHSYSDNQKSLGPTIERELVLNVSFIHGFSFISPLELASLYALGKIVKTFPFSTELNLQRNVFALLAALPSTIVVEKLEIVINLKTTINFTL